MHIRAEWTTTELGITRTSKRRLQLYSNPIARARLYEEALMRPSTRSHQDVAAHFGVTAPEVCRYVALVQKLPPDIVARIESEADPRRLRILSLRKLTAIVALASSERQRSEIAALFCRHPPYE